MVFSPARFFLAALLLTGCATSRQTAAPLQSAADIQSVANFRDVGGYKTADGHSFRHGLLFRSAQLSGMTPEDGAKLIGLGIRYEIDLRSEHERNEQPSHWGTQAPEVRIPFHYAEDGKNDQNSSATVSAAKSKVLSPTATVASVDELLTKAYGNIILERAGEMGTVLHGLAWDNAPALIHCTGGKDRTGETVAVLMTILGVPREQVYSEYLRSNEQLAVWYEQTKTKMRTADKPYPVPFELFSVQSGVRAAWLDSGFAAIDRQYGSFDLYVRDGLKLSPQDIDQLKARYLER